MKQITREDVITEFTNQVAKNGGTTTLDVKLALRAQDFEVDQKFVSDNIADFIVGTDYRLRMETRDHRYYFKVQNVTVISSPNQKSYRCCSGPISKCYSSYSRGGAKYLFSKEFNVPFFSVRSKLI